MSDNPAARRSARAGFTLLELVVASSISTILLLAITSAIVLASKALPESSPATAAAEGVQAVGIISAELAHAKTITRATSKGIEFTVADRDNDAVDEKIAYDWSGTAGAPLVRAYNGTTGPVINKVSSMALALRTVVEGEASRTIQQSTSESTVFSATSGTGYAFAVSSSSPVMETFKAVSLPAGATTWTIERIDFYLTSAGTRSAQLLVSLYEFGTLGAPVGSVIASATIDETAMPTSFGWYTLPMGRVQGLDPTKKYALVITQGAGSGDSATLAYLNVSSSEGAANGSLNTRVLVLWVADNTRRLAMQVRATAVVNVTTPDTRRTVVKQVDVDLKPNGSLKSVASGVKLLNEPGAP